MRVGRVEAFAVRYPEPNNDGKIRALTLVRVETDDGLVGWGEAITGGQETSLAVAFVVERRLAPLVVGGDPRDVAGVWSRLRDATLLGRQRRAWSRSASAPSTWRCGTSPGKAAGRPALPPARRQAAGPPPGLRLDHLRHATTSTASAASSAASSPRATAT